MRRAGASVYVGPARIDAQTGGRPRRPAAFDLGNAAEPDSGAAWLRFPPALRVRLAESRREPDRGAGAAGDRTRSPQCLPPAGRSAPEYLDRADQAECGERRAEVSAQALLTVTGLRKQFPVTRGIVFPHQVGAVKAVDGLDFTVAPGETLE